MVIWLQTLISVFLVSIISLVGIFIFLLRQEKIRKISLFLVSFAVGALFGDAFIHLLPEAFEKSASSLSVSLYVVLGIIIFFCLEKFLRWRHCHIPTSKEHPHPVAFINLVGDGVHNFIDGLMIGASYLVSLPVGLATTLAIVFHEIPQEIGDFGVFIHAGLSRRRALFFNFLSALAAVLGAVISLLIGWHSEKYVLFLLPLTAGGFLYIAGSDLIPELHHEVKLSTSLGQLAMMVLGVGVMAMLTLLE